MACGSSATSAVERCYLWQPPSGAREPMHGLRRHPQRPGETRWNPVEPSYGTLRERKKRKGEREEKEDKEEIGRAIDANCLWSADPLNACDWSHRRPVAARISACSIVFLLSQKLYRSQQILVIQKRYWSLLCSNTYTYIFIYIIYTYIYIYMVYTHIYIYIIYTCIYIYIYIYICIHV